MIIKETQRQEWNISLRIQPKKVEELNKNKSEKTKMGRKEIKKKKPKKKKKKNTSNNNNRNEKKKKKEKKRVDAYTWNVYKVRERSASRPRLNQLGETVFVSK